MNSSSSDDEVSPNNKSSSLSKGSVLPELIRPLSRYIHISKSLMIPSIIITVHIIGMNIVLSIKTTPTKNHARHSVISFSVSNIA